MTQLEVFRGVVFGKSIRSHYAILHVGMEEPEKEYVVVRIHFPSDAPATELCSWCWRSCKLRDLLELKGHWSEIDIKERSFVVNVVTLQKANELLQVMHVRYWSMPFCQEWQWQYRPKVVTNDYHTKTKRTKTGNSELTLQDKVFRHGGSAVKRKQGDCIANFVIHLVLHASNNSSSLGEGHNVNPEEWATSTLCPELHAKAVMVLNKGSGVIDATGSLRYVSLALGLKGVQSTVVDPRESVGKLPKKDRKLWNRVLRSIPITDDVLLCQPVVPYESLRAWFAQPPRDVDTEFRRADLEGVPVCAEDHELVVNCSAIVALHPDEATDVIVDMAVQRQVPFVVVPCCVFSRFFPDRQKPNTDLPVTTYLDLIDYLASKHDSIRRTTLPFEGANVALWSIFQ